MSRAVLYKRSEELKRRYSLYGLFTAVFYLVTMLVGGVAYASSNLPVYLSRNAATASGYGDVIFLQSVLVLISFILLATSALLIFLSRATTSRGEFASSFKLLYLAIATAGIALSFSASAAVPPASGIVGWPLYLYLALIAASLAMTIFAVTILRGVISYYAPRRK